MMSEDAWMHYLNEDDPAIMETLKVFRENNAFPTAPQKEDQQKKVA
jgi:carboxyl-terminal processing protease